MFNPLIANLFMLSILDQFTLIVIVVVVTALTLSVAAIVSKYSVFWACFHPTVDKRSAVKPVSAGLESL